MIDFIKKTHLYILFIVITLILSIFIALFNKIELGMDFTGGGVIWTSFQISDNESKKLILENTKITKISHENQVSLIYLTNSSFKEFEENTALIKHYLHENKILKTDFIGAKFGKDALKSSFFALILSLLAILLYVWFKFGKSLSIIATIALMYNCLMAFSVVLIFKIELNLMSISAFLTLIGYCINDTVVVFDRIKQIATEFRFNKNITQDFIINTGLNKVLVRSIKTSGITAIALLPMIIFTIPEIKNFAIIILSGIFFGTISSIIITPILYKFYKFQIKLPKIIPINEDPMRFV